MRTLLFLLAVCLAAALPAQDDRDRTTPVESQWLTDQTETDLANLQAAGWRFTDLDVTAGSTTATLRFSVVMVKNTGAYAKTWTFVTAASPSQLSSIVQAQNMRLVDIEASIATAGQLKFAAVFVANTGADAKAWWWGYDQSAAQVDAAVNANNGRLVCLHRYVDVLVPKYAFVMISNTGADQRAWGYLYDASITSVQQTVGTGMRVYAMERRSSGNYDAIFVDDPQNVVTSFQTLTTAQAREYVEQNLERIVDVEPFTVSVPPLTFSSCTVTTLDNANPLEQTARYWFTNDNPASRGDYGFFLKEVNGPVLAAMRPDTPFEPAGLMTTLYHTHVLRRVALGQSSLTNTILKPVSCGGLGLPVAIGTLLGQMMENGDTMAALAISNAFGIANIETTGNSLGMASTNIAYTLGCSGPSPQSTMTLRDLSTLHESVANGYLRPGVTDLRPTFYEKMREDLSFPTWNVNHLDAWIDFYGATAGLSPATLAVFKQKLHIAWAAGGASWPVSGTDHFYYSEGGWMSVPFRAANGQLAPKEFTFGVFNHDYHALETDGREWMSYADLELVWDRVKAALDTWTDYVPGGITFLPGGSCPGSNGSLAIHSSTSLPDIEETVVYSLVNAPTNGIAVTMFGFSNTVWNGVPLPVDLAPIGAPFCLLRTEPSVTFPGLTDAAGQMSTPIVIGTDTALIGAVWYSQCLLLDPPANAFGATLSNGLRTQIGGSF